MKKSSSANLCLVAMIGATVLAAPVNAQTSGSNGSHDPSRMLESEGKVYIYSTGGGGKSSTDGLVWASAPGLQPEGWAKWVTDWVPSNQGLWAPDGIYHNGQYLIYYSVCGPNYSGKNTAPCAMGLKTTPTLNSSSPNYKMTDRGMVVSNNQTTTFGAIDAAPLVDSSGNLWFVWGGGYTNPTDANSIWVTRLDNATGLPLTTDPGWNPPNNPGHPILKGRKEGAYIHYRNGYYYLFWNTGGCCSGTSSTYTIHVARSRSLTGPYPDDKTFYSSNASLNIHGPGHMGIYGCGGSEVFTYHYYPDSRSVVGVNSLSWGSDGWPVAGGRITSPIKLGCASTGSIKSGLASAPERNLRIQKTAAGYRIFVPGAPNDRTAELLNVGGKRLGSFRMKNGWGEIPAGMLAKGINIVQIAWEKGVSKAVILHRE